MESDFSMHGNLLERVNRTTALFLLGAAYGVLLSLAPVALICHRRLFSFLAESDWPKLCFYLVSPLVAGISAAICFPSPKSPQSQVANPAKTSLRQLGAPIEAHAFEILATIIVFLFVACAALSEKLAIAPLQGADASSPVWPITGLLLILSTITCHFVLALGAYRQEASSTGLSHRQPRWHWTLSQPVSVSWIILLAGISLLFSTWFPLLSLPGIFIGMKWRLRRQIENSTIAIEAPFRSSNDLS
jgi:hypothetical protein